VDSGTLSPYALVFLAGIYFGVTYNVHQDKMVAHIPFESYGLLRSFKTAVHILRQQITIVFIFSWFSIILTLIPTFDQDGTPTRAKFLKSWADFLPFGNLWMDLFNLGFIVTFVSNIFMNKYDSSFNMMSSNISAILSLWTGWVPAISTDTVGFVPSVWLTVPAMVLASAAVYPSYKYSLYMKELINARMIVAMKESVQ